MSQKTFYLIPIVLANGALFTVERDRASSHTTCILGLRKSRRGIVGAKETKSFLEFETLDYLKSIKKRGFLYLSTNANHAY